MVSKQEDFSGKKVTVMGLGLHGGGVSVVRFFSQRGAKVTATDLKTQEQLATSVEGLADCPSVQFVLGGHRHEDFTKADMVVISPAVSWNNPHVRSAQEAGVRVEMDSSLFVRECPCPLIGITGTKGKTTTSLLVAHILKRSGIDAHEIGIGQIPVLDALEKLQPSSVSVFEFSSWRLGALAHANVKKSPHIAIITNIFPDHLNYYATMEQYIEDKKNIFRWQKSNDWCVLNHDEPIVRNFEREIPSQVVWYGFSKPKSSPAVFVRDGQIFLDDGIDTKRIASTRDVDMRGKHNLVNTCGAIAAVWAYGVSMEKLVKHVPEIDGVPHRLEFVGNVRGVQYYNDTTATIPEAVVSALHSFTQPVILIAGGSDKGLSYEAFAKSVSHRVQDIVFLSGTATSKMRQALAEILGKDRVSVFPEANSMIEAVTIASEKAKTNDIVLLSPGATSFGMFENEFDRGDQFRKAVRSLPR